MATHEIKKCTKIIDEVLTFLIQRGHNDVSVRLTRTDNETQFIFSIEDCPKDIIETLQSKLSVNKEQELIEYSWELLGESDICEELLICGMLIDKFEVLFENNITKFILHRKY